MSWWSLRARLTFIFVLFFGGTLCGFSYYIYRTMNSVFQSEFDALLLNFTSDIADSIDFGVMGGIRVDSRQFREGRKIFPFPLKETVIQIRDLRGRSLEKSNALGEINIPFHQNDIYVLYKNRFFFRNWTSSDGVVGNKNFRIAYYRILTPFKPPVILQVAVPDRFVRENSIQVLNIFMVSVPIVLLIASLIGYTFSAFGLSPIQRLIDRLKSMGPSDLGKRLELPSSRDEIHELSSSINSLLDRLEGVFKSQETFVSDASHQLKTPLAVLKGELELLQKELDYSEARSKVVSLREEIDDLISLVNNLLLLARVDAGEGHLVLSEVPLDEVVTSAVERLGHLAKQKGIRMKLTIGEGLDVYGFSLTV
ncbi:MAG: HAMP domain-containing protein, partial [Bdellovibrionales bacterium]|nr:HAMP domain-containing protein [Bdellovibrionales bacterium]